MDWLQKLRQQHAIAVRPEWLEKVMAQLRAAHSDITNWNDTRLFEALFTAFLFCDLNQAGAAALPANTKSMHKEVLEGKYVLQLDEVLNMAAPARERYTSQAGNRCLKFALTDGCQQVVAVEHGHLPAITWDCPAGTKLLIHNVPIRRGLLLLGPDNTALLGGQAERLEAARQQAVAAWNRPVVGRPADMRERDIFGEARQAAWAPGLPPSGAPQQPPAPQPQPQPQAQAHAPHHPHPLQQQHQQQHQQQAPAMEPAGGPGHAAPGPAATGIQPQPQVTYNREAGPQPYQQRGPYGGAMMNAPAMNGGAPQPSVGIAPGGGIMTSGGQGPQGGAMGHGANHQAPGVRHLQQPVASARQADGAGGGGLGRGGTTAGGAGWQGHGAGPTPEAHAGQLGAGFSANGGPAGAARGGAGGYQGTLLGAAASRHAGDPGVILAAAPVVDLVSSDALSAASSYSTQDGPGSSSGVGPAAAVLSNHHHAQASLQQQPVQQPLQQQSQHPQQPQPLLLRRSLPTTLGAPRNVLAGDPGSSALLGGSSCPPVSNGGNLAAATAGPSGSGAAARPATSSSSLLPPRPVAPSRPGAASTAVADHIPLPQPVASTVARKPALPLARSSPGHSGISAYGGAAAASGASTPGMMYGTAAAAAPPGMAAAVAGHPRSGAAEGEVGSRVNGPPGGPVSIEPGAIGPTTAHRPVMEAHGGERGTGSRSRCGAGLVDEIEMVDLASLDGDGDMEVDGLGQGNQVAGQLPQPQPLHSPSNGTWGGKGGLKPPLDPPGGPLGKKPRLSAEGLEYASPGAGCSGGGSGGLQPGGSGQPSGGGWRGGAMAAAGQGGTAAAQHDPAGGPFPGAEGDAAGLARWSEEQIAGEEHVAGGDEYWQYDGGGYGDDDAGGVAGAGHDAGFGNGAAAGTGGEYDSVVIDAAGGPAAALAANDAGVVLLCQVQDLLAEPADPPVQYPVQLSVYGQFHRLDGDVAYIEDGTALVAARLTDAAMAPLLAAATPPVGLETRGGPVGVEDIQTMADDPDPAVRAYGEDLATRIMMYIRDFSGMIRLKYEGPLPIQPLIVQLVDDIEAEEATAAAEIGGGGGAPGVAARRDCTGTGTNLYERYLEQVMGLGGEPEETFMQE